jgi:hypothetical protein
VPPGSSPRITFTKIEERESTSPGPCFIVVELSLFLLPSLHLIEVGVGDIYDLSSDSLFFRLCDNEIVGHASRPQNHCTPFFLSLVSIQVYILMQTAKIVWI